MELFLPRNLQNANSHVVLCSKWWISHLGYEIRLSSRNPDFPAFNLKGFYIGNIMTNFFSEKRHIWFEQVALHFCHWHNYVISHGAFWSLQSNFFSSRTRRNVTQRMFSAVLSFQGKLNKSRVVAQEHENPWSHLWLSAQDCHIFLKQSFLPQSGPVCSSWTGDFVCHQPLSKASRLPAALPFT